MNQTHAVRAAPVFHGVQPAFPPGGSPSRAILPAREGPPRAWITGDLALQVSEQEAARGSITGHYAVETPGIREPHVVRWHAPEGTVEQPAERATAITFDLGGTRVGQRRSPVITVQVTEVDTGETIILGTFVQIRLMNDPVPSPSALPPTRRTAAERRRVGETAPPPQPPASPGTAATPPLS